ncbi:MAG: N-acetylglucosamine-6-phosphate deacetylase [Arthrobacter sp.]|nr:N-acetylglucosamine-6-phosphate deacetylase [Arthrobacter sp.]
MRQIIHSARRLDRPQGAGPSLPAPAGHEWVAVNDGVFEAEGRGATWRSLGWSDASVVDAAGRLLTAGWVDQHCHGAAAVDFDGTADYAPAVQAHRAHGTRALVASLVTNPLDVEAAAAIRLARAVKASDTLVGIHLEGPFLDHGHKGAHAPQHLRPAALADVQRLYDACEGELKQITLAPEHDENLAATRWLAERGVAVAVGHTSCTRDVAMAAFDAGASVLTHAFNGMPGLHHREPGPLGAALDSPHVTLELIADLVHVAPTLIRTLFAAAPGRIALITDAMSATGCSDGEYMLGELAVDVQAGVARLREGGSIAGSTLTMDEAVLRTVGCGVSVRDAVTAATLTPARAMSLPAFPALGARLDAFLVDETGAAQAA